MNHYPLDPIQRYLNRRKKELAQICLYTHSSSYKEYPRAKQICLSKTPLPECDVMRALDGRESVREFGSPLSLEKLGSILFWSAGEIDARNDKVRRRHPSGGAKYPLEIYVVATNISGLAYGVYHYNIRLHVLEHIPTIVLTDVQSRLGLEGNKIINPGAIIVISFIKQRSLEKYGNFATKLGLLEAGHLGQNLYLTTTTLDLGLCALGLSEKIAELNSALKLDGINESIVYACALGEKILDINPHITQGSVPESTSRKV